MTKGRPALINVELTIEEVDALRELAHFYDSSLRPVRAVVRLTSRREVRSRFRFVKEESQVLSEFASATHEDMIQRDRTQQEVSFTPRALVSFWGRALASLHNKRSRRRLSPQKIEEREALAAKLQGAAQRLVRRDRGLVERELATRRPIEASWMRERLGLVAGGSDL